MTERYQQKRVPDGSRTRTGCITCRIRKKKCDEQRPACQACRSRQLACYGFDAPAPTWFTSKASWKDVRESEEAKSLQVVAETRYKIHRKAGPKGNNYAADEITAQNLDDNMALHSSLIFTGPVVTDLRVLSSFIALRAGVNIWQLRPESIWWDSKIRSLAPAHGSSSHEETRLLMLFLDVIHPITHTFYKLDHSRDRSWMLDRIVSNEALYHSALSISACFDHSLSQSPNINDIGICSRVRDLQCRAVRELQIDLDKFASMQTTPAENFVWKGIQLLDVIVHLNTLEIFSMLQGHWEMHHHAARRILNHIEICGSEKQGDAETQVSVIEAALLSLPPGDSQRRSLEFSLCNFIWLDVLATSTFGLLSYFPCAFDYLSLLQAEIIRPQDTMGCQGLVMATVVKIVKLEEWKMMHQDQIFSPSIYAELLQRGDRLSDELKHSIDRLEGESDHTDTTTLEEDSRLISIIWAYGAQVLRQVVVSDMEPAQPDMDQTFVNLCLQKLEELPTRLVMRASWPYTIAGCMSSSESQHARFRRILGRVMQEAQPPGISWKGLIIMEECWRLRQTKDDRKVNWRDAMESLRARVILT